MEYTAKVHVPSGQVGADQQVCDLPEASAGNESVIRQADVVMHEVDQLRVVKDIADQDYRRFPESKSDYGILVQQGDTLETDQPHTPYSTHLEAKENTSYVHNGKEFTPLCSISQVNLEIQPEKAVQGSWKDVTHNGEGVSSVSLMSQVKLEEQSEKAIETTLRDAINKGEEFPPVCSVSQVQIQNQSDKAVEGAQHEEALVEAAEMDDEEMDQKEQVKVGPGFVSAMLRDGSLSAEGLASKGFYVMEDDDSEDEDSTSDDDTEEEISEGGDSDDVSSDSEDENFTIPKEKIVRKVKDELNDCEDLEPPRTKHELQVLPPVSKITAVLEAHHEIVYVGRITSVLDSTVIVEAHGDQKVLNEKSILWLSETRKSLGVVDEVFGPVKNPYYLVRFNAAEEIPPDAKVGASVSYVSEFSDFILKENPDLYKRAVDASGLDDEELGSDEDQEFSDDEKEAAARRMVKNKRANGGRETRSGQGWNKTDGPKMKGTRKENVRYGAAGASLANGTGSSAIQECDMWQSPGPECLPRVGRHGNHRKGRNSAQNSGHEQNSRMVGASGASRAANVCNGSALLAQSRQHNRDGTNLVQPQTMHTPNFQIPAQQQTYGMVGVPSLNTGAIPPLHAHGIAVQQQGSSFHPYNIVPSGQLSRQRQGTPYTVSQGPHINIPQAGFNFTGMDPNSVTIPHGGHLNMCPPRYVTGPHNHSLMGHGISAQPGLRDMQPGLHPSHMSLMMATPVCGSGVEAQEFGSQPTSHHILQGQVPFRLVRDGIPYNQGQTSSQAPPFGGNQMNNYNHRR